MPRKPSAKPNPTLSAVIDIGSNEVRLKIAERVKDNLKYIESLTYPLSLGRDTFDTGRISFEKADKVCGVMENFLNAATAYGVSDIDVVATSAVREAVNRDYILDQIKNRTGRLVRVLDDAEEKLYLYRSMLRLVEDRLKASALMIYTGSGNVGISALSGGRICYAQNIKLGALRVSKIFAGRQDNSESFFKLVDDYVKTYTKFTLDEIPNGIQNFIASGHEVSMIAQLCGVKTDRLLTNIPRKDFDALYAEVTQKSISAISYAYDLPYEKAEQLIPSMCIYRNLLEMTGATEIISQQVTVADALLLEKLFPGEMDEVSREYAKHTVTAAQGIADKYCVPKTHYELVRKLSEKIFDKMKKIGGLDKNDKLLLQVVAILHDVGKFVNIHEHCKHSYNIIKGVDIFGLNDADIDTVANVALYHSNQDPSTYRSAYGGLPPAQRVLISKLTAILRLADSLDKSESHKFSDITVKIAEGALEIQIETDENLDLEEWAFAEKSRLFNEVFGMKAVLKKKKVN